MSGAMNVLQKTEPQPYSGYYLRDVPEPDAELTRTGPGTPMGELMRRFWQPVCLSSEIADLPHTARILGEDLVVFRDKRGEVGVLLRHCSHRGTSLEYGIVSERGIRCCYHGWLFDIDGTVLETPGEPPDSAMKDTLRHGAYPAREYKGLVFAYMGPPDEQPEFPILDTYGKPDNEMVPYSVWHPCNWLQVKENFVDPAHAYFLHSTISTVQFSDAWAEMPTFDWDETPDRQGMYYITARRVDKRVWVRSNHIWLPNVGQVGALLEKAEQEKFFNRVSITRWTVPIDDTHAWIIGWRHFNKDVDPFDEGRRDECGPGSVDFEGQTGNRSYEEKQRVPGDWDAQVSQTGDRRPCLGASWLHGWGSSHVAADPETSGAGRDGRHGSATARGRRPAAHLHSRYRARNRRDAGGGQPSPEGHRPRCAGRHSVRRRLRRRSEADPHREGPQRGEGQVWRLCTNSRVIRLDATGSGGSGRFIWHLNQPVQNIPDISVAYDSGF